MKNIYFLIVILTLFSCKTQLRVTSNSQSKITQKIIKNAQHFLGTKYRYGGTTKKGMDCSGLIYTSFKLENINLPRTSSEQSKKGKPIKLSKVKKGDLLFFITNKGNKISHVGLVVAKNAKGIKFIHSSNSLGVTISSLDEKYWSNAFRFAKRIIK